MRAKRTRFNVGRVAREGDVEEVVLQRVRPATEQLEEPLLQRDKGVVVNQDVSDGGDRAVHEFANCTSGGGADPW